MPIGKVYKDVAISHRMTLLGIATAVAALVCIGLGVLFHYCWTGEHTICKSVILGLWIVGVPSWFGIEYFYIYKKYGVDEKASDSFEHFKHGQDVATKAWLAVITVLTSTLLRQGYSILPELRKARGYFGVQTVSVFQTIAPSENRHRASQACSLKCQHLRL